MSGARLFAALAMIATVALPRMAAAHSSGMPEPGCAGCHGNNDHAAALSPAGQLTPGQTVTMTIAVQAQSGQAVGAFVSADAGTMTPIAGEGLVEVPGGLTHFQPKPLDQAQGSFSFRFTPPNDPGSVRFVVTTVVANNNGSSSGDLTGGGSFDFVYGCDPITVYWDVDGDGFGRSDVQKVDCAGESPLDYAEQAGDCNDNDADVYPGALEVCNQIDDDCDGAIDDDAVPAELYLDEDGDGYYSAEGPLADPILGCLPLEGYAADGGDCDPDDPTIHPGAEETCNLRDDDCDGELDEGVRPICGEGACEREATGCSIESCSPGEPTEETCNFIDDNCNTYVDEGAECSDGSSCIAGECRADPPDETPNEDAQPGAPSDSGCTIGSGDEPWALIGLLALGVAWLGRRRARRGSALVR